MIDSLGLRRRMITAVRNQDGKPVFGGAPGETLRVYGRGFGSTAGQLMVADQIVDLDFWGGEVIQFRLPATLTQPLIGVVRVTTNDGRQFASDFTFTIQGSPAPNPDPMAEVRSLLGQIIQQQGDIVARLTRMESIMAATQVDVDELNTRVQGMSTAIDGLGTDLDSIDSGIQAIKNANPGVDVTALQASVQAAQDKLATADTHAQAIATGLAPSPTPTPAPTPAPEPTPAPGSRR